MTGIYKITNPEGEVYIGQSVSICNRFSSHRSSWNLKKNTKLYKSFSKYGVNAHIFEVVRECTVEELSTLEREYQEFYDSVGRGLNMCYTSTMSKPGWVAEEVKNKISQKLKGRSFSTEHKIKLSEVRIGKKPSLETLEKRKVSLKGVNSKRIQCTTDGRVFNSIKEATVFYGLKWRRYVEDCCAGRMQSIKGLQFKKIQ